MSILNRDDARSIARKLGAEIITRRRAHDLAVIFHNGLLIARFGIRRGRRDLGHDHIMADLHVSPRDARRLADCSMSFQEWLELMAEKGYL